MEVTFTEGSLHPFACDLPQCYLKRGTSLWKEDSWQSPTDPGNKDSNGLTDHLGEADRTHSLTH